MRIQQVHRRLLRSTMRTLPLILCIAMVGTLSVPGYAQAPAPALPTAPEAPREKPPQPSPEDYSFKPTRTKPLVSPLFTFGVLGTATLGFLTAGIVFNVYANDAAADAKSLYGLIEANRFNFTDRQPVCTQPPLQKLCARQEQRRSEWEADRDRAIGLYAASGGFFILTATIALYPWLKDLTKPEYRRIRKTEALQFTPMLSTKEQGIQLQYNF